METPAAFTGNTPAVQRPRLLRLLNVRSHELADPRADFSEGRRRIDVADERRAPCRRQGGREEQQVRHERIVFTPFQLARVSIAAAGEHRRLAVHERLYQRIGLLSAPADLLGAQRLPRRGRSASISRKGTREPSVATVPNMAPSMLTAASMRASTCAA